MSEVKIGDRVRDCDPRSNGRVKVVVAVADGQAVVRAGTLPTSKVRLDRIHNNPNKKSGYYLLPEGSL